MVVGFRASGFLVGSSVLLFGVLASRVAPESQPPSAMFCRVQRLHYAVGLALTLSGHRTPGDHNIISIVFRGLWSIDPT